MKGGQKSISERKFFPGYVLVQMDMTDDTWHLVKSTAQGHRFHWWYIDPSTPISEKKLRASCSRSRRV